MSAALTVASATPDAGLVAAVIVAAGVTALVALGMMLRGLHRGARLTALRTVAAAGLGAAVVVIAVGGVLAVSPAGPAQAAADPAAPTYVVGSSHDDLQLPTLPLD